jgi:hypothetical protein
VLTVASNSKVLAPFHHPFTTSRASLSQGKMSQKQWVVAAIHDWRCSHSAAAAATLFSKGDDSNNANCNGLRPDWFELSFVGYSGRSWTPIANIAGGYTSPLVQDYIKTEYLAVPKADSKKHNVKRNGRSRDYIKDRATPSVRKRAKHIKQESKQESPMVVPENEANSVVAVLPSADPAAAEIVAAGAPNRVASSPQSVREQVQRQQFDSNAAQRIELNAPLSSSPSDCSESPDITAENAQKGIAYLLSQVLRREDLQSSERSVFVKLQETMEQTAGETAASQSLNRSESTSTERLSYSADGGRQNNASTASHRASRRQSTSANHRSTGNGTQEVADRADCNMEFDGHGE